jgi:hypothetical protein
MFRKLLVALVVLVLAFIFLALFLADGSVVNLAKNLGYLFAGILALWGLVAVANHFGITGKSYHLGTWLDAIADSDAAGNVGPKANPMAMGLVVASVLIAGALLVGPFIRP